ncbi:hypothetical protein [Aquimarina litoralis]|uniref:hypothetical protein n=1 Tax=Aquimarina litoralis TaxID=584605 RepID=UPI001C55EAD0|nr:hypothetical protein [Aquimarina litoralis]MBW1294279.1 hypothetical protein [Aquimarina litoralis]
MNEKEDYFFISKKKSIHVISSRTPIKWKELLVWSFSSFFFLVYFTGLLAGLIIAILTTIGYTMYRFAAWIYYTEIQINEDNGSILQVKKILGQTRSVVLIADTFDTARFEYIPLNRSGKNKFLMRYKTHKDNDLLILKNKTDRDILKDYMEKDIRISNN